MLKSHVLWIGKNDYGDDGDDDNDDAGDDDYDDEDDGDLVILIQN